MVKISTKGRYGLSLMLDLASNDQGVPIRIKEISARLDISDKYLEQIASILLKANLIRSIRGAYGGYYLRRKPEDYKVGEILRVIEGDLAPVECVGDNAQFCVNRERCATVLLWQKINDAINDIIDHITLEDLKNWQQNMENGIE